MSFLIGYLGGLASVGVMSLSNSIYISTSVLCVSSFGVVYYQAGNAYFLYYLELLSAILLNHGLQYIDLLISKLNYYKKYVKQRKSKESLQLIQCEFPTGVIIIKQRINCA